MSLRSRVRDESGATAVLYALLIVVFVGLLALTIDGGLLWVKYRKVRTANDAAALSWALSCAQGDAANAQTTATGVAQANGGPELTLYAGYPQYGPEGCSKDHGKVTVKYGGTQGLSFGPAVGVSSPKPVVASATAAWGAASVAGDVFPLMLTMNALSSPGCGVPDQMTDADIGVKRCAFFWDSKALGSSTWGLMNLDTWGAPSTYKSCNDAGNKFLDWVQNGYPQPLPLNDDSLNNPTFVCADSGQSQDFYNTNGNNDIVEQAVEKCASAAGCSYVFPVNNPGPCPSDLTKCQINNNGKPYLYAIVGFAFLRPVDLCDGKNNGGFTCAHEPDSVTKPDQNLCNQTVADPNNQITSTSHCLVLEWEGYSTEGVRPGSGPSFGLKAVTLSQ